MIKQIKIGGIPPYFGGAQRIEAKHINFLFGLNGSGKTTISRFLRELENPNSNYNQCSIEWSGNPLKCEVYNKDYVKDNFGETSIPGIFTLGEENIERKGQIDALNGELKSLNERRIDLQKSLDGTNSEVGLHRKLTTLDDQYTNKFWGTKQQLDREHSPLQLALEGVRGSKSAFKRRLLLEKISNKAELKDKSELEQLCTQLFGNKAEKIVLLPTFSFDSLISVEDEKILGRVIVGKEDVDISGLIKKLGNDRWFRQGIPYIKDSDGLCPFCQSPIADDFMDKVKEYFDESYLDSVKKLEEIYRTYVSLSDDILSKITAIIDNSQEFVNTEELRNAYLQFQAIVDENKRKLLEKKEAPNIAVRLDSIKECADTIDQILKDSNIRIKEYNDRVEHIKDEKITLTGQVWRFILEILASDIKTYLHKQDELKNLIETATKEFDTVERLIRDKTSQLHVLEQHMTSVVPTANGINALLQNYGITSFSLKVNDVDKTYQFIRSDGSPAFDSLSEGERNFVTFLYFMYSLNGNKDESGHNDDKIVVIDDPVSSLDNDVLFLVSSLLRDLFKGIYTKSSTIKQLFVLSHNSYFFKEVSYKQGLAKKKTGYWMIVKTNDQSQITEYKSNPVSSTYEMLWDEVKRAKTNPESSNTIALSNTMRRILEYYFDLLGGMDLSKFHLRFQDGERQVFKSLISWANAGSHSTFDDYSATPNLYTAERYLKVFRDLFDKIGHIAHYNMMMKINEEETENGQAENAQS